MKKLALRDAVVKRIYLLTGVASVFWLGTDLGFAQIVAPSPPTPPASAERPQDLGTVTATSGAGSGGVVASGSGSLEQARALKRLAPNLIEVQPQEEIRKLPDYSLTDAISRVPGVSIETDTAEGRYVNIRGLDTNLNATTFSDVRLTPTNPSSPFGGGRAVPLDTFPSSLIGGFELTKSLRPDQDAEGLGGQINILPRRVLNDGKMHIDATILGGIEPLRNSPVVGGDVTVSLNFGYAQGSRPWDHSETADLPSGTFFTNPHPFSFIYTESHFNDQRGIDDFEPAYNDTPGPPANLFSALTLRRYDYQRRRFGRGGEFDFKPNDNDSWFFRYLESGYTDHQTRHAVVLGGLDSALPCTPLPACVAGPGGAGFLAPAASAEQDLRNTEERLKTRVFTWGGENLIADRVKIDYHGAFVEGSYSKPYDYNSTFGNPNTFPLAYNNLADPQHPSLQPQGGLSLADPTNYFLNGIVDSTQKVRDREWSGALNVSAPLDLLTFEGVGKLGGHVRLRERTVSAPQQTYGATTDIPYAPFTSGPDQVYYDGNYNLGPAPNPNVIGLIGTSALTRSNLLRDGIRAAAAQEDDRENIYAWYGQYQATRGRLGLLAGIRFEQTVGTYGANTVTTQDDSFAVTPSVNRQSYFNYFPTVQARYEIEPTLIARAAYSTAIARPGFSQITAATLVDPGAGTVTSGNPTLKPTTGDSFDVSIEKYLPQGGIISLGAFGKIFQHYILPNTIIQPYPGISGVAQVTTYTDGGGAHAYGLEAAYVRKFDFLPAPWSEFGVAANYTYVQSGVQLHPGTGEKALPSTASHNANVALFYERAPFTFRLAGAFVSKSLFGLGATRDLDLIANSRFTLDLSARYKLNDHLELFTNARNLTDARLAYSEGPSHTRYNQREYYGPTIYSGARVTF